MVDAAPFPKTAPAALDDASVGAWADALAHARLHGGVTPAPAPEPRTSQDAFAIQKAVALRLAQRPRGWKTAGAAADGLPLIAPLLEGCVLLSKTTLAEVPGPPLVLEVEFGLRLGPKAAAIDPAACRDGRDLIDEVFVAMELCRTRLAAPHPPRPLFLADGLANAGLVVGDGVATDRRFRFEGRRVRLWVNGRIVIDRMTRGQAADGLLWLARQTEVHGGLREGDMVITGSLTGSTPLQKGDTARAVIEGVGEAEISLG